MQTILTAAASVFLLMIQASHVQAGDLGDLVGRGPIGGETAADSPPPPPPARHYSVAQLRNVAIFGARLSMRLADARVELEKHGLRRSPFKSPARILGEAQVLEADYAHPAQNTRVGLFYAVLPNGERRISRILLWEEIPVVDQAAYSQFLTERYGVPTNVTVFQGHDTYVWSQMSTKYIDLLRSVQCLMPCISSDLVAECSRRSISSQVFMSGGFNTNMPGKLYWTLDANDLALQRNAMISRGEYPRDRPICPKLVI